MDGYYDRDKKKIKVGGNEYDADPSVWERIKEGFDTTDNRAQVEAIRRRRAKYGG